MSTRQQNRCEKPTIPSVSFYNSLICEGLADEFPNDRNQGIVFIPASIPRFRVNQNEKTWDYEFKDPFAIFPFPSTRPGKTPVCSPSSTKTSPFTIVILTPRAR